MRHMHLIDPATDRVVEVPATARVGATASVSAA